MEKTNFMTKFSKENKEEIIRILCEGFGLKVRSNSKNNFLITLNEEILEDLELHKMFILFLTKVGITRIEEFEDITTNIVYCTINI